MSDTPSASAPTPSPEDLKRAFKAFKKRLKVTRLDNESSLSGGLLGGRNSSILGISPPTEFPQAVWDELVKQGKLKRAGRGIYELVGE